jgi:hypothetical protein
LVCLHVITVKVLDPAAHEAGSIWKSVREIAEMIAFATVFASVGLSASS